MDPITLFPLAVNASFTQPVTEKKHFRSFIAPHVLAPPPSYQSSFFHPSIALSLFTTLSPFRPLKTVSGLCAEAADKSRHFYKSGQLLCFVVLSFLINI